VIDSVGFKGAPIWIDENANPQSEAMHADLNAGRGWMRVTFTLDLTVD